MRGTSVGQTSTMRCRSLIKPGLGQDTFLANWLDVEAPPRMSPSGRKLSFING